MARHALDDRDAAVAFNAAFDRLGDPVTIGRHRRAREPDDLVSHVRRHLVLVVVLGLLFVISAGRRLMPVREPALEETEDAEPHDAGPETRID